MGRNVEGGIRAMEDGVGMNTTAVPWYVIYTALRTSLLTSDSKVC